jgi:hypothetical protein
MIHCPAITSVTAESGTQVHFPGPAVIRVIARSFANNHPRRVDPQSLVRFIAANYKIARVDRIEKMRYTQAMQPRRSECIKNYLYVSARH